jgi:hypothetical protein
VTTPQRSNSTSRSSAEIRAAERGEKPPSADGALADSRLSRARHRLKAACSIPILELAMKRAAKQIPALARNHTADHRMLVQQHLAARGAPHQGRRRVGCLRDFDRPAMGHRRNDRALVAVSSREAVEQRSASPLVSLRQTATGIPRATVCNLRQSCERQGDRSRSSARLPRLVTTNPEIPL